MIDHTGIVVSDLAKARTFYDAVAKALKLETADNGEEAFLLGRSAKEALPFSGSAPSVQSYWAEGSRPGINQSHLALVAPDKAAVDAFHAAALAAGGRDHGAPGPREGMPDHYGTFVLDPDGNNIEACVRGSAARWSWMTSSRTIIVTPALSRGPAWPQSRRRSGTPDQVRGV